MNLLSINSLTNTNFNYKTMENFGSYLISHPILALLLFMIFLFAILIGGLIYAGHIELLVDLHKEYDTKYKVLKIFVPICPVSAVNFQKIKDRFAELEKYACRDKERIDVLYRQFENRFHQFFN